MSSRIINCWKTCWVSVCLWEVVSYFPCITFFFFFFHSFIKLSFNPTHELSDFSQSSSRGGRSRRLTSRPGSNLPQLGNPNIYRLHYDALLHTRISTMQGQLKIYSFCIGVFTRHLEGLSSTFMCMHLCYCSAKTSEHGISETECKQSQYLFSVPVSSRHEARDERQRPQKADGSTPPRERTL